MNSIERKGGILGRSRNVFRRADLRRTAGRWICVLCAAVVAWGGFAAVSVAKEPRAKLRRRVGQEMPKAGKDGEALRRSKAAVRNDASVSQQADRNSRQVAADSPGPKAGIQCEESVHDFGTVWVGPALKHTFTIKNTG